MNNCGTVLMMDTTDAEKAKAYFRRGMARAGLTHYDAAARVCVPCL